MIIIETLLKERNYVAFVIMSFNGGNKHVAILVRSNLMPLFSLN